MCLLSTSKRGNRQCCDNYRISLLVGKLFVRLLLSCLNMHLEDGLIPRKSMWFSCWPWHSGYGFCCQAAPGEMSRTVSGVVYHISRPNKGLSLCLPWRTIEDYDQIWMSRLIHHYNTLAPWGHDGPCPRWWWGIPWFSCLKWHQARLCFCPSAVQHNVLCHAGSYWGI